MCHVNNVSLMNAIAGHGGLQKNTSFEAEKEDANEKGEGISFESVKRQRGYCETVGEHVIGATRNGPMLG